MNMRNIIGWASFIRWLSVGNVDIFEQGKQQDAPVRTMPRYKEIVQIFDVGSQLVFVDSYTMVVTMHVPSTVLTLLEWKSCFVVFM